MCVDYGFKKLAVDTVDHKFEALDRNSNNRKLTKKTQMYKSVFSALAILAA